MLVPPISRFVHLVLLALHSNIAPRDAFMAAIDTISVTDDPLEQDFAIVWCGNESGFDHRARSKDGYTFGRCQVAESVWGTVPEDPVEQLAQGIAIIRYLQGECGTFYGALVSYSIGPCYGTRSTPIPKFVDYRCGFFGCKAWEMPPITISLP